MASSEQRRQQKLAKNRKRIIDTLQTVCGEGNANFMMPSPGDMAFDEEDGRWVGSELFND
jgi:hypothetical protein